MPCAQEGADAWRAGLALSASPATSNVHLVLEACAALARVGGSIQQVVPAPAPLPATPADEWAPAAQAVCVSGSSGAPSAASAPLQPPVAAAGGAGAEAAVAAANGGSAGAASAKGQQRQVGCVQGNKMHHVAYFGILGGQTKHCGLSAPQALLARAEQVLCVCVCIACRCMSPACSGAFSG